MEKFPKESYRFTLPKAWKHLKLITKHRVMVWRYCWKAGLYWQGMVHDLSKYSPTEFFDSVRYYTGVRSPIDTAKDELGFSAAWLHHKGCNRHHYEYWLDYLDEGGIPCKIPFRYVLEMVCDYIAAGKVYGGDQWTQESPLEFWNNKKKRAKIHKDTVAFLDSAFVKIAKEGIGAISTLKSMEQDYLKTSI